TFVAPSKTFTDLRRSVSWWAPYLIIAIVAAIFMFAVDRQVGFEQVAKNDIARSPRRAAQMENATPEQRAQQMKATVIGTRIISYCVPLLILIFFLIFAGIYMGVFNLAFNAH